MTSLAQSEDEKSAKVWWWFNSIWSWVLWLGLFLCIPLATVGWYVEDAGGAGDFDPNHMLLFHLLGTISSVVLVLMASASVLFFAAVAVFSGTGRRTAVVAMVSAIIVAALAGLLLYVAMNSVEIHQP